MIKGQNNPTLQRKLSIQYEILDDPWALSEESKELTIGGRAVLEGNNIECKFQLVTVDRGYEFSINDGIATTYNFLKPDNTRMDEKEALVCISNHIKSFFYESGDYQQNFVISFSNQAVNNRKQSNSLIPAPSLKANSLPTRGADFAIYSINPNELLGKQVLDFHVEFGGVKREPISVSLAFPDNKKLMFNYPKSVMLKDQPLTKEEAPLLKGSKLLVVDQVGISEYVFETAKGNITIKGAGIATKETNQNF